MTNHLGWRVQNLEDPIFTSGFLFLNATNNSWRLHRTNRFCLHRTNTFLYAYIILSPRKLSPLFIVLIESMSKINFPLGYCFTFFREGCTSILFLSFSSLADRIKYCETPKYSEQYFHDQE